MNETVTELKSICEAMDMLQIKSNLWCSQTADGERSATKPHYAHLASCKQKIPARQVP